MALTDKDLMPFGKYRGTEMANVPAYYLIYIYNKYDLDKTLQTRKVLEYIEDNLEILETELKNGKDG